MPKQVVTKQAILEAAFAMTRKSGFETVNARSVAEFMERSVQPIYSYFQNMSELKEALYNKSMTFYDAFIRENSDMTGLESMALANVLFARREPNLFRLLFLSKQNGYYSFAEIFDSMGNKSAADVLAKGLGVSAESASELYVMMIIFTHGIATMLATGGADIKDDEIGALIGEAYRSFVGRKINNEN